MDLTTCPNCLGLSAGDDACPLCGADADGEGAEVEFDAATRTAIQGLGGLFGGILATEDGDHLLWCSRGVCLVREELGLAWRTRVRGTVDDVRLGADEVRVRVRGEEVVLGLDDGLALDESGTT